MRYFLFFILSPPDPGQIYIYSTVQFMLATFQVLSSHTWHGSTILATTERDRVIVTDIWKKKKDILICEFLY